jgi:general secretion pathway protein E
MAQRLIRVICPNCKAPDEAQEHAISIAVQSPSASLVRGPLYKGMGCEGCLQTGYLGRTGIFELLIVDDEIKEMITKRCAAHTIKQAAVEKGMSTLRDDGLRKALAGETTLEEVCRVTQGSVYADSQVAEHAGS